MTQPALLLHRCLVAFLCAFSATLTLAAPCPGKVINPLTDVCWRCVMPITIGKTAMGNGSNVPDLSTDANPICSCGRGVTLSLGINLGFWEPVRTVEIVRHPWCFPSLGGISMQSDYTKRAPSHARAASHLTHHRRTSFYNVHWYVTPWLFVLEALLDQSCLEQSPWDLAYLSELDPLWDDTLTSFILAPEASLFTSGAAQGACALDCLAASAGLANESLYWCSGCQGFLYPLSGWVAAQVSPLQAWHLLAHRFATKLAREGLLWSAHGSAGQCGPYYQPIMPKNAWRTQLLYPARTSTGTCCFPLGHTTMSWGSAKTFPITGEDGALLLWRRRDCCQSAGITAGANPL